MITVEQFIQISQLDSSDSYYENNLIAIVFEKTEEEIDELSIEQFRNYIQQIDKALSIRKVINGSVWKDKSLFFDKINEITFGQYIDLEAYVKKQEYNQFLRTFFNQKEIDFLQINVSVLFNALDVFTEFQKLIFENYSSLFASDEKIDEEDEELTHPIKRFQDGQNQIKEQIQKKWGWTLIVFQLAKNDITKIDKVLDCRFTLVINILLLAKENQIQINPIYYPPSL